MTRYHRINAISALLLCCYFVVNIAAQIGIPEEVQKAQTLIQAKDYDGAIKILEDFTQKNPNRMGALSVLGTAYQGKGEYDKAIATFEKVRQFPPLRPSAIYHIATIYVLENNKESAFKYLQFLRDSGAFDMTLILTDPNMKPLKDDSRFERLIPKRDEFANPFVENVKIIREWDGEQKGSQFGWIARRIGDVDGDGAIDFVTSAPTYSVNGQPAGKIYVYSSKSGKLLWSQTGQGSDNLGIGVECAGDTNGDGIPDVVASAPGSGRAYVYSGKDGRGLLTLSSKDTAGEAFGRHVATAGDINGDGRDDVIIGAPGSNPQKPGHAYIYSGKDGGLLLALQGENAGDGFGSSVAGYKNGKHSFV